MINISYEERIANQKEFYNSLNSLYDLCEMPEFPVTKTPEDFKWFVDKFISLGAIPKDKLIVGKEYIGGCRNSDSAVWTGTDFIYTRYKFGTYYDERINHFEDDDGYDVFVPINIKN